MKKLLVIGMAALAIGAAGCAGNENSTETLGGKGIEQTSPPPHNVIDTPEEAVDYIRTSDPAFFQQSCETIRQVAEAGVPFDQAADAFAEGFDRQDTGIDGHLVFAQLVTQCDKYGFLG